MLGYEEDDDFQYHESVDQDTVEEFALRNGPGPEAPFHLHCSGGRGSPWNRKVVEMMVDGFEDILTNDEDFEWSDVSREYLESIVWDRLKRLLTSWQNAQRVENESDDEYSARMDGQRNDKLKLIRHFTRRGSVS